MALSKNAKLVLFTGVLLGLAGSLLGYLGNPTNTGICISCFLENTAGAFGLHDNIRMQYFRPELPAFILGSFLMALIGGEFKPKTKGVSLGGVALGFLMILGSAVFIGCPIKMLLRLAAGDLTAIAGVVGLVVGVKAGLMALGGPDTKIFGESRTAPWAPLLFAIGGVGAVTILFFVGNLLKESTTGGGALHAPAYISFAVALAVGVASQRSRFCITGSVRDMLIMRRVDVGYGLFGALIAALVANIFTGQFSPGYLDQPGTHLQPLWGFLGMALTGWAAVLAGGCPFRQLIKAGEGDLDGWTISSGMLLGAIVTQTWSLGASVEGVYPQAKVATLIGFAFLAALSIRRNKG